MQHDKNVSITLNFVPKTSDGECRCKKCGRLLAKIKSVNDFMVIEIKCPKPHCKLVNTFEVSRNANYSEEDKRGGETIGFSFKTEKR